MRRLSQRDTLSIITFAIVLISYLLSRNFFSGDSRWSILTAYSLIEHGTGQLDEYRNQIESEPTYAYAIEVHNGHLYSFFPIGPSLVAIPFVMLVDAVLENIVPRLEWLEQPLRSYADHLRRSSPTPDFNVQPLRSIDIYPLVEFLIASIITALSVALAFPMFSEIIAERYALFLAFVLAYCTSMWSIVSRSLWQHGPSILMLVATMYVLERAKRQPVWICAAGLTLAFAYVSRPTNSLTIAVVTLWVVAKHPKYIPGYLASALTIAIPFLLYNQITYGNWLPSYYQPQRLGSPDFLQALLGHLISPGRGLFIFSPVLAFGVLGAVVKVWRKSFHGLDIVWATVIVLHWLVISAFKHWWGGFTFGPRLFSDTLPMWVYFMAPALEQITRASGIHRKVIMTLLATAVAISFAIHYQGANNWETVLWNIEPVNIDAAPNRLWDWKDLQFLRGAPMALNIP